MNVRFVILLLSFFNVLVLSNSENNANHPVKISGYVSYQFGQVMKGWDGINRLERYWVQSAIASVSTDASVRPWLNVYSTLETHLWYSIFRRSEDYSTNHIYYRPSIKRAEGVLNAGPLGIENLKIGIGVFQFKYNPDARNLGEYLFRCNAYPPFLTTDFDYAMADLLGFRASLDLLDDNLNLTCVLNSEIDYEPIGDFSLSLLARGNLSKIATLGAGVNFDHLLSVDTKRTVYKSESVNYIKDGDTMYYSFRATKLAFTARFDPKILLGYEPEGKMGFFGQQDFVFYGELSILGVNNYPLYYEKREERMPLMIGFNFPGFKIIDLISIEGEYYNSPYLNHFQNMCRYIPLPVKEIGPDSLDYKSNVWRWSVYGRKNFGSVSLIALAANDHILYQRNSEAQWNFQETCRKHGDWHWVSKFQFNF